MNKELQDLRKAVGDLTKPSLATLKTKAINYASRPLSEFDLHDALEMMETLQNTARDNQDAKEQYYRIAYQTARSKTHYPKEHFRALVLRLLGDKDHQTVFEAVAKVEKGMHKSNYQSNTSFRRRFPAPYRFQGQRPDSSGLQCRFCKKFGQKAARCFKRRRMQNQATNNQDKSQPTS